MPTYDYICKNCEYEFEQFQAITARPIRRCPRCRKTSLKRLVGSGSGVIFKGPGFYQTDYRSENYKKGEKSEKGCTDKNTAKKKTDSENKVTDAGAKPKPESKKKSD